MKEIDDFFKAKGLKWNRKNNEETEKILMTLNRLTGSETEKNASEIKSLNGLFLIILFARMGEIQIKDTETFLTTIGVETNLLSKHIHRFYIIKASESSHSDFKFQVIPKTRAIKLFVQKIVKNKEDSEAKRIIRAYYPQYLLKKIFNPAQEDFKMINQIAVEIDKVGRKIEENISSGSFLKDFHNVLQRESISSKNKS